MSATVPFRPALAAEPGATQRAYRFANVPPAPETIGTRRQLANSCFRSLPDRHRSLYVVSSWDIFWKRLRQVQLPAGPRRRMD